MNAADGDLLDLRTAADELGVHYQTAYGWVRSGRLKAELIGGRYLVSRDDLDAVRIGRQTPSDPKPPGTQRLARSSDRMHHALLTGDEPAARQLAVTLVNEGTSVAQLIQLVFVPSLVRIGQAWHEGKLTVWVEHRASAIVERILGELAPNPRGRRRGTALVAAVSGDHHSLPTTMAAVTLRDDNWHVEHLGANMPPDELVHFCAEHPVNVAVITSTNPDTADLANEAAETLRAAGIPTIVGAPGRTLDDLIELARQLSRENRRP
ncbi:MAG TPA: B12-binding domain-containing protein [Ilumatobacteraceae bacterium]|nr:B12-binding domain-containing protein [Ilumatobacteraceae bacterium]